MTVAFDDFATFIGKTFGRGAEGITRDTVSANVPGWDSLNHVTLMLEIETVYGVSLEADETAALPCVGALYDLMIARMRGISIA